MSTRRAARCFTFAGRALGTVCVLSSLAGCSELELPEPPDMSALVRAYEEPDGELTRETATEVGIRLAGTVSETNTSSPVELIGEMVTKLQATSQADPGANSDPPENEGADENGSTLLGERLDVAAIVRLHHVCRGWEGNAPPNEALNGSLDLTATFDSAGLIPTIWGTTNACRHERRNTPVELDGDVRIRLGSERRVNLGELESLGYIVQFDGRAAVMDDGERAEFDLHTNFRIVPGDKVQLLIALDDGSVVIGEFDVSTLYSDDPVITGGLITRDSRWSCSLDLNDAHGSCTDANDPTSTIEW